MLLGEGNMGVDLEQKIRNCAALPTLPAAAVQILHLLRDGDADIIELGDVIATDPALAARVLRAVNSSFYGLGNPVSNVSQAVALLGMNSVTALALGFSLTQELRGRQTRGFNHLEYWRRSMYAACAARLIARRQLRDHQEDCFIAALLMDVGTLVLHHVVGEEYDLLCEKAPAHADLLELESKQLGMTHADVAGMLAAHWKLPPALAVPMASHHAPESVSDIVTARLTRVVWLAGRSADVFVNRGNAAESIAAVRQSFRKLYEIDELQADGIMCAIGNRTSELATLFDVKLNAEVDYEKILLSANQRLLELSLAEQNGNKRRAERKNRQATVLVLPCERGVIGQPIRARLRDMSAGGIGLIHGEPMDVGTQFIVQLPAQGNIKTMLYKIVRCEEHEREWISGAELVSVLQPEAIELAKI